MDANDTAWLNTAPSHGGSLADARRLFPGAPEPWLDLSTGLNPLPYPVGDVPPEALIRLPEPAAQRGLEAAAAAAYGVADPALLVAAPGTQLLIELLPLLFPAREVAVLGPTYAEHGHAWAKAGARIRMARDIGGLAAAEVAVLCNPNNPDGKRHSPEELFRLADDLAGRGGMVVVDEAFADLEPPPLSLSGALPHPAIMVLRSFGKTYGLAGLRLGFAATGAERARRLRTALGPWAVSGPAIVIGERALRDHAWLRAARARLTADAARLDALLGGHGLALVGGTMLFRLVSSPLAGTVFDRLGRAGIYVRRFRDEPSWLRFGLPASPADHVRLEQALAGTG